MLATGVGKRKNQMLSFAIAVQLVSVFATQTILAVSPTFKLNAGNKLEFVANATVPPLVVKYQSYRNKLSGLLMATSALVICFGPQKVLIPESLS
jgi:hypothetical protein